MNKHLEELIELSKIDQSIDAFEPKVNQSKTKLEQIENQESDVAK